MDGRPTWTDCDEAGDYVVPNVLSPRDLVFRPDNMDETVTHTEKSLYIEWTRFRNEVFYLIVDLATFRIWTKHHSGNLVILLLHCLE